MLNGHDSSTDLDEVLREFRFEPDRVFAGQLKRQLQSMIQMTLPASLPSDESSGPVLRVENHNQTASEDEAPRPKGFRVAAAAALIIMGVLTVGLVGLFSARQGAPPSPEPILPELESITPENAGRMIQLGMLGYGYATDVAWSPDGKTLAVGTSAGIVLYDTGALDAIPQWHEISVGHVNSVAFSPDGSVLAVAGKKGLVLWEVVSGQEQAALDTETEVIGVAYSPDGAILASGGAYDMVRLWDTATGQLLRELTGYQQSVTDVAFSSDGRLLAAAGGYDSSMTDGDGVVRVWDVATGGLVTQAGGRNSKLTGVAFSPDGRMLATGSRSNRVVLWDLSTGEPLAEMTGHTGDAVSVAFSPDGALLASAGGWEDSRVTVWDVAARQPREVLEGCAREAHSGEIARVAFSPDGALLVSPCGGSGVMVWDVSSGQSQLLSQGYGNAVNAVTFNPEGSLLASSAGWEDGQVRIWDVAAGKELFRLSGHTTTVTSMAFSPDGTLLASGSRDGTARLWEASSGAPLFILEGLPNRSGGGTFGWSDDDDDVGGSEVADTNAVWSVGFNPDGRTLAVGRGDPWVGPGYLDLYSVTTGRWLFEFEPVSTPACCEMITVFDLEFSPDGMLLASANGDGSIRLWDTATGQEHALLEKNVGWNGSNVTFSPDGTVLASAGSWTDCSGWGESCDPEDSKAQILLWDGLTGQQLAVWEVGTASLADVAFSPDGRMIASLGGDLRLWDMATGEVVAIIQIEQGTVIAFSPDGARLAVGDANGGIHIWGLQAR